MRPLTSALDSPAAIPHEPVRMEIYRDGVLLGADEGWLGRRNGALAYEGRRTRFEIVITDLDVVPRYTTLWEPTRLRVNGERGVIEVEFRPWYADDASRARIQEILSKWPWAIRRTAGPPSFPDSRRPYAFLLSKTFDKMVLPILVAGVGLAALTTLRKESESLAYTAFVVSLAFVGAWIFQRVYRRDREDRVRLEARDRESPLARASAPTEPTASENVEATVR